MIPCGWTHGLESPCPADEARRGLLDSRQVEFERIVLEFFEGLWRFDFIAIDLSE